MKKLFPGNRSSVSFAMPKPEFLPVNCCHRHAISDATFCTWRRKLPADAMMDKEALQVALCRKF